MYMFLYVFVNQYTSGYICGYVCIYVQYVYEWEYLCFCIYTRVYMYVTLCVWWVVRLTLPWISTYETLTVW